MKLTHIPEGQMCMVCTKLYTDCSKLNFNSMPPKGKWKEENLTIILCTEFDKGKALKLEPWYTRFFNYLKSLL